MSEVLRHPGVVTTTGPVGHAEVVIALTALGISDKTKTVRIIKKALHFAILRGIENCINATIEYAKKIVPESHPGGTNPKDYPPSYITERLMKSYILQLQTSFNQMAKGKATLRDVYTFEWDWLKAASYAVFVDEMRGVDWTKSTSEGGFIDKLERFIKSMLAKFIQVELNKEDKSLKLLYSVGY